MCVGRCGKFSGRLGRRDKCVEGDGMCGGERHEEHGKHRGRHGKCGGKAW